MNGEICLSKSKQVMKDRNISTEKKIYFRALTIKLYESECVDNYLTEEEENCGKIDAVL